MTLEPSTGGAGGFGWNIDSNLPPPGQYVGVCLDIKDGMDVDRKAFQSEQMEKRDITRFLFGLRHPQTKQLFLIQTFEMTISGAAQSNLVQFLRGWMNRDPYGFDYLGLKGSGALLTIAHKQSTRTPGLFYATITGLTPVYPTLQAEIPAPSLFTELLAKANSPRPMLSTTRATGPGIIPSPVATFPSVGAGPERKFWTPGTNGQPVLVTEQQLLQKGEPQRQVMAENMAGGWVLAHTVIAFPVSSAPLAPPLMPPPPPMPSMPPMPAPPPPPVPGWEMPGTTSPADTGLPATSEELPF